MTVNEAIKVCNVLASHGYGGYDLRTECGFAGISCYPNHINNDNKTINMEGSLLDNYEDRGDLQMICDEISEALSGGVLRMHNYFYHLYKNWCVAFHALTDFFAHFLHGLLPFIKIKHHQPVLKVCALDVEQEN